LRADLHARALLNGIARAVGPEILIEQIGEFDLLVFESRRIDVARFEAIT